MVGKIIRLLVGVATMHLLLATGVVRAQSPSPEALAAARELIRTCIWTSSTRLFSRHSSRI
jgi:hypothetical protein